MPTAEQENQVWELIKPIQFGMLSTHHRGCIHARPMALVQDEFNGCLYFFTQDDSLKVAEVTEEQEVGVSFSSSERQVYVSLSGNARLSKNKELIEKYWHDGLEAYFPQGKADPHLALMEINIDSAQSWSSKTGQMVDLYNFGYQEIGLDQNPPNLRAL